MARSASSKPPAARASPPPPASNPNPKPKSQATKRKDDYTSEGVEDNDVFLLPGSDYQLVIAITVLSAAIRLFRIYQPTSVVFDEVQYVPQEPLLLDVRN
jgi:dolichyl-phosphate-mannose-protein mannosyltransferase